MREVVVGLLGGPHPPAIERAENAKRRPFTSPLSLLGARPLFIRVTGIVTLGNLWLLLVTMSNKR